MRVYRKVSEPIRVGLDTEQRWHGPDQGLIAAWERGRQKSEEDPELAARARAGELVVLPWKGGVERVLKNPEKFGTKRYLATWQGLRGAHLDVDLGRDTELKCTATGMTVVFTSDATKYAGQESEG